MLIGLFLIIIAMLSLVAVSQDLTARLPFASNAALIALQDIFTTIIVAELLMTVLGYLKSRTIDLRLILWERGSPQWCAVLVIGIEPLSFQAGDRRRCDGGSGGSDKSGRGSEDIHIATGVNDRGSLVLRGH